MRQINEIIIHCTATQANWWGAEKTSRKVAEVRRWHMVDRGWKDIGYHYLIDRDGTVAKGRPLDQVGAHVQGHNTGTIGISLFGGFGSAETDQFSDNFTVAQDKALRELLVKLCQDFQTVTKISGHNQYAAKACPGFNVPTWYAKARGLVQADYVIETPKSKHEARDVLTWSGFWASVFAAIFGKAK